LPGVTSFRPLTATTGEPVKIVGKNFTGVTGVSFGGSPSQSFKIISDSVIFAYVGAGTSGDVLISTPAGSISIPGFVFYTPQQYTLYGISKYGTVPWPQNDSSMYQFTAVPDTAVFQLKKINRYDSLAIGTSSFYPEYSPYVDSPNYVIFSGVVVDGRAGYIFTPTKINNQRPLSVFAKIIDTVITIPAQTPDYRIRIWGKGVIKNNKISLQYLADYRGQSKNSTMSSQ
jgi:hypothetical protein